LSVRAPARRRRALLAVCLAPFAAAGCVSVGREAPVHLSYALHDLGTEKPVQRPPLDLVVLVAWSSASAFYDTTSIVYSRAPGALAYYQLSSWSERPAEQIGRLFAKRLAGAGVFRDVATMYAAVRGDWLVELQLDEMLHDDATPPGVARVSVFARLVDRSRRRTLQSRRFHEKEPLQAESAAAAVKAFDVAVTRLLDASVGWLVEAATRGFPEAAR